MVLRLRRRQDVQFESYDVFSGEVAIGMIARSEVTPTREYWVWSIGRIYILGDGRAATNGTAPTRAEAMAGLAARWRLWLKTTGLTEIEPGSPSAITLPTSEGDRS